VHEAGRAQHERRRPAAAASHNAMEITTMPCTKRVRNGATSHHATALQTTDIANTSTTAGAPHGGATATAATAGRQGDAEAEV
jgi:hypothetical protein